MYKVSGRRTTLILIANFLVLTANIMLIKLNPMYQLLIIISAEND